MPVQKKTLWVGIVLLAAFFVVLVVMFMPVFNGMNALNYMDALYNSISKESAYYLPGLTEEVSAYRGRRTEVDLKFDSPEKADLAALLLRRNGAEVEVSGAEATLRGDLGGILAGCLADADDLFKNDSARIESEYGREGRETLFGWWTTLKALDKGLKRQSRFEDAAFVTTVKKKGVECAYNYYGIEPRPIRDNIGIVLFSLVFYVVYTVWYGYAIILIFEGCGLRLSH